MYMFRRRQVVSESNFEDFDDGELLNARHGWRWLNFNFPVVITKHYFHVFGWVYLEIIASGKLLDTINLAAWRVWILLAGTTMYAVAVLGLPV